MTVAAASPLATVGRILVCDAEPEMRARLRRALVRGGHVVDSCRDPADCLRLLARAPGRHSTLIVGGFPDGRMLAELFAALEAAAFAGEVLVMADAGADAAAGLADSAVHAILPRRAACAMVRQVVALQQRAWRRRRSEAAAAGGESLAAAGWESS